MARFAMASKRLVDVANFTEDDAILDDIAHHLSKIQRFNGGAPINITYSVAEHCINLVQHAQKQGGISRLGLKMLLLHDASEAYLSDIVSPAKKHLPDYQALEASVQRVINKKFCSIDGLADVSPLICDMDRRIIMDEVEHVNPSFLSLFNEEVGLKKLGCHIHYNNHPATVRRCFLTLAQNLGVV